jgi:hypothetical protein
MFPGWSRGGHARGGPEIKKFNQTSFQEETMKKFWIVLLALGLVAGFALSASAADVKFSGSYYVMGLYIDNPSLKSSDSRLATDSQAVAMYHQRMRIQTEFKIAEGLSLVTRFDALEKDWGQGSAGLTSWRGDASYGYAYDVTNRSSVGATGVRTQENIEFERAYIDVTTKIGRFNIGYQDFMGFGTMFLNTHLTRPGIKYFLPIGPLTIIAAIEKAAEGNAGDGTATDVDSTIYDLGAVYKFGAGDAGLMYQYGDNRASSSSNLAGTGYRTQMHFFNPYARAKFGPVYVEGEAIYGFGKVKDPVSGSTSDSVDGEGMGLYLQARADIGPAYLGGTFAYMRGDDPATTGKKEGGFAFGLVAGQAWCPTLIMWSDDTYGAANHMSALKGYGSSTTAAGGTSPSVFFDNAWLYQVFGGIKPTKDSDIMLKVTYAYADKKPYLTPGNAATVFISDVYGTEVDLVAKYKIFDNLEYMIGAAYLWTGDYFKANLNTNKIDNNYLLVHKLTLTF